MQRKKGDKALLIHGKIDLQERDWIVPESFDSEVV